MNNFSLTFDFDGTPVRTAGTPEHPLFCLPDVCAVLGIDNPRNVVARLNLDGVHSVDIIDSLGRAQSANFVDEPNLYRVIFQSRKPNAQKFQSWVFGEVLPQIRRTGAYQPQSPHIAPVPVPNEVINIDVIDSADMFQHVANVFSQQQRQINQLSDRLDRIEANKIAATQQLRALPPATVPTPTLATRKEILKAVNLYCQSTNVGHHTAWNQLYAEFYLRCGVAVKRREHYGNETHLDVAVRLGYAEQLYAIALDLFGFTKEVAL